MKKYYRFSLFIFLSAILLASCVYDKEFAYMNDQIIALNRRVTKIQDTQATLDGKLSNDLDVRIQSIRSSQANAVADLDQLRGEIKELSGRIEDNERIIKRTVERDLGDQDSIKASLTQLKEKVDELDVLVKRQQEYLGLASKATVEGGSETPEGPREESTGAEAPGLSETGQYDIALAAFRNGRFEDAMEGFEAFLKKYPKSDRADNAQFWIGECFMALKHYEQAILAYQKVIKKYPGGNKAPNAMLRQAMAFLGIKDKTSTKLLLRKIIKSYPKSNEAEIAQKKLKSLK